MKANRAVSKQILAFSGQVLPAAIGMGSFMLLVRILEPAVFGEYIIYITAVVLFEMVKSGGLQSAIIMRISKNSAEEKIKVLGSAYWIGTLVVLISSLLLLTLFYLPIYREGSGFRVFCLWYAILGFITLPIHLAEAQAVAEQKLKFLLIVRVLQSLNPLVGALMAWRGFASVEWLATFHVGVYFLILLYVCFGRFTNPLSVKFKCPAETRRLFGLIKYTLATLGATNILKSADTFLIGAFFGPALLPVYAIPQKLTELFEIPLRTLSTTAFPTLASKFNQKDKSGLRKSFTAYMSWTYILFIPGLVLAYFLAPFLVRIIGGEAYADSTDIFRIFVLFGFFLPFNRLTGILLDAVQKPGLNFKKVAAMAIINIVADGAAIYFTDSLLWVAFASVVNAVSGCILGWYFISKNHILSEQNRDGMDFRFLINDFIESLKKIRLALPR